MKASHKGLLVAVVLITVMALLAIIFGPLVGSGSQAVRDAVHSQLGIIAIAIVAGGVILLALVMLLVKRCADRPHPPIRRFLQDEGGTAAVEMLLALPIILMILLVILQAVLLWNAVVVFHYANYSAARAAVSIIPSHLEISGEEPYRMFDPNSSLTPPSIKLARIERAAALALVPISGRYQSSEYLNDPELTGENVAEIIRTALQTAGGDLDQPWLNRIADQYRYADAWTLVSVSKPHHWNYPEPERGRRCPYHHSRREWGTNDWLSIPYCPYAPQGIADYAPWEEVDVQLGYGFEMSILWANKVLHELMRNSGYPATAVTMPGTSRTSYIVPMFNTVTFVLSG